MLICNSENNLKWSNIYLIILLYLNGNIFQSNHIKVLQYIDLFLKVRNLEEFSNVYKKSPNFENITKTWISISHSTEVNNGCVC